jgi:hypothetical protein
MMVRLAHECTTEGTSYCQWLSFPSFHLGQLWGRLSAATAFIFPFHMPEQQHQQALRRLAARRRAGVVAPLQHNRTLRNCGCANREDERVRGTISALEELGQRASCPSWGMLLVHQGIARMFSVINSNGPASSPK